MKVTPSSKIFIALFQIGDGSDDGSKSARIKVVTGADNDKGKSKRGKGKINHYLIQGVSGVCGHV